MSDDNYFDHVVSFMAKEHGLDESNLTEEKKSELYWEFEDSEEYQMKAMAI